MCGKRGTEGMFVFLILALLSSVYSVFGYGFSGNKSDFSKLGSDIHYEQSCSPSRLSYTQELIGNSSDLETDMASLLHCSEGKVMKEEMERIPDICFYAGMLRSAKEPVVPFYVDCPSSKNLLRRKYINRETRPCLNKNYVKHTAQSFHYMAHCFDFTSEERNDLFALFNHESSFMSNASSKRNALISAFCMGQITLKLFKDLNKFIQARNQPDVSRLKEDEKGKWEPYGDIYKKAEQKCPSIKRLVVPPEILTDSFKKISTSYKLSNSAPFGCSLTSNLPACLFYSMYYYRILQERYRNRDKLTEKQEDAVKKAKEDIMESGGDSVLTSLLPIGYGEMLVLKGDMIINGRQRNEEYVFETNEEIRRFFKRNNIEYDDRLIIYKINVFPKKDLENHFLRTGHNGGSGVISRVFPIFMKKLKSRISQGSVCSLNSLCNSYRTKLLNGETLSVEELQAEWMKYVQRYPGQFTNPQEVEDFSAEVEEDIGFIRNEGVENDPTPLARKFSDFHSDGEPSEEVQGLTNHFVQRVQVECAGQIK